jgi:hypothetical protein
MAIIIATTQMILIEYERTAGDVSELVDEIEI